jgi:hypothetical protein
MNKIDRKEHSAKSCKIKFKAAIRPVQGDKTENASPCVGRGGIKSAAKERGMSAVTLMLI